MDTLHVATGTVTIIEPSVIIAGTIVQIIGVHT